MSLTQTFNQALEEVARKRVYERINELGKQISSGNLQTFDQYKYNCGIIKGLNEALAILDQSLSDIQTAGRGAKDAA